MKITVLTYLDSEDENSKDYEKVVPQVARTLRSLGHRVSILGVHGDVKRLISGLSRRKPDLVFNLMEMFGDNVFGDIPVTGLLDLLGLKYTGSGPGELYLSQDKGLTKKLLAFDGILYPRFAVFARDTAFETGGNLHWSPAVPAFSVNVRTFVKQDLDNFPVALSHSQMQGR